MAGFPRLAPRTHVVRVCRGTRFAATRIGKNVRPITFDELRLKLGGGPIRDPGGFATCDVPKLPVELLDSLEGLTILENDFPGCFMFLLPVAEGDARYVGVTEIDRNPTRHGKGRLELFPHLD
jgi:hypothetical protein